jgi:protein TonB
MYKIRMEIKLAVIISVISLLIVLYSFQEDPYLPFAQVMPTPIGGMEGIYKHVTYPELAKNAGVSGKVYVLVYINENGGVDQVKVVRGIGAGCDEAAVEGVKATKFSPGKNNGIPVKVKLSLAIIFKIN